MTPGQTRVSSQVRSRRKGGGAPRTPEPRIWLGYGGEGGGGCGQSNPTTSTARARAPIAPSPSRIRPASAARCAGLEKALRCSTVLSTKPGGWNPESGQSALGRKQRDQRPWEGGTQTPPHPREEGAQTSGG